MVRSPCERAADRLDPFGELAARHREIVEALDIARVLPQQIVVAGDGRIDVAAPMQREGLLQGEGGGQRHDGRLAASPAAEAIRLKTSCQSPSAT